MKEFKCKIQQEFKGTMADPKQVSSKYEVKMKLLNKLIIMQKLKAGTLFAGINEVLHWEPLEEAAFLDDTYEQRKRQEWELERLPQGKAVLKTAFATQ